MEKEKSIVILDFGGQYAHLIARRVRSLGAFSEIHPPETAASALKGAAGIILSGGPQSVYEEGSPQADLSILNLGIPILGLCYGHQWIAHVLGGKVEPGKTKEYGRTKVRTADIGQRTAVLFRGLPQEFTVWMSHGDSVKTLPKGFSAIAASDDCLIVSMEDPKHRIFGLQFHPEVTHTEHGMTMLKRFVELCKPAPWSVESYAKEIEDVIRRDVGDRNVFMLVSGGVDSTVAFTLLNEVLGASRVQGLLVDTGLMRKDEVRKISAAFEHLNVQNLRVEDASEEFFAALREVYDPEEKRRVIGDTFLDVQSRIADDMGLTAEAGWLLGQGTIYPDTIETGGTKHADHIKTHHNRVEAIQRLIDRGLVVEPLKELYKDEVRALGEELGLPHQLVWRHPFPGPGFGVRILCSTGADSGQRTVDSGVDVPHVMLPVLSVGVQGDARTYRTAVALFDATKLPEGRHERLATEIPNRSREVSRVVFCTSHASPPEFVIHSGYVTRERADLLREADDIVDREMHAAGLYEKVWQFPVVLLPFGTSSGGQSIVLRPVESQEAMTADVARLPGNVITRMTKQLLTLPGIDAVFLDLTSKPPATIEWE